MFGIWFETLFLIGIKCKYCGFKLPLAILACLVSVKWVQPLYPARARAPGGIWVGRSRTPVSKLLDFLQHAVIFHRSWNGSSDWILRSVSNASWSWNQDWVNAHIKQLIDQEPDLLAPLSQQRFRLGWDPLTHICCLSRACCRTL